MTFIDVLIYFFIHYIMDFYIIKFIDVLIYFIIHYFRDIYIAIEYHVLFSVIDFILYM